MANAAERVIERRMDWNGDVVFGLPGDAINGIVERPRSHPVVLDLRSKHDIPARSMRFVERQDDNFIAIGVTPYCVCPAAAPTLRGLLRALCCRSPISLQVICCRLESRLLHVVVRIPIKRNDRGIRK